MCLGHYPTIKVVSKNSRSAIIYNQAIVYKIMVVPQKTYDIVQNHESILVLAKKYATIIIVISMAMVTITEVLKRSWCLKKLGSISWSCLKLSWHLLQSWLYHDTTT